MHRQNAEEREAERHAANRLLLSLQTGAGDHPIKTLGAHNALAAAASLAHQTAANLFNPTAVPHPINLLSNGQTAIPHHLLSPKSTASNSSASRDQAHETDLNQLESSNQSNSQTMQRHLNQLMHHQLLSNSQHHSLLTGASSNLTTTTSTPSSTTSAPSTTPPSGQFSTANSLAHHSSFNAPATSLESSTPNVASLHDFHSHQNPSINAALAALNAPGHLLNRHFSQLSHLHRLGAHYPMPTLANGQAPGLPAGNQSLIGHHLQSNGQLIDSTTSPSLTAGSAVNCGVTTSPSTTNPAHLYSLNQLSQLSHYAQLGFLGGNPMLQSLQMAGQRPKDERNELESDKKTTKLTNLNGSDEEACFTEDENGEAGENMEINVASDDEDCKTESSFNNEVDEKDAKIERSDRSERSGRFRKRSTKKLKTADGSDRKVKEEEDINIDENSKESLLDENSCSKIDELLRSKEERRKIKLKPYKLISSTNSIVGSA